MKKTSSFIPFNRPYRAQKEHAYLNDCLDKSQVGENGLSGDNQYTQKCHAFFEEKFGTPKALLTTSCTHALEMSALLLDIQPGDEVIVPAFTFVSTINAFILRGAKPIFCDIRPDTLNLDEKLLPSLITNKTKAIVPVHYAGVGCEMDAILEIANTHGIAIIEDNAHGLFGKYKGKWLGTFGVLATQSFHETKNFSCGEGGALFINHTSFIDRAEILREKGTNRRQFFQGKIDKYTWVDLGSSYLPSDILASILLSQLEDHSHIQNARKKIWDLYFTELRSWAEKVGATFPTVPDHCEQAYHMFYMLLPSNDFRSRLMSNLKKHAILTTFHYQPLHLSPMGQKYGGQQGQCPVTEDIAHRLIRLPLFASFSEKSQTHAIETLTHFD